jgi:phosphoribosylanthranilate isomerase
MFVKVCGITRKEDIDAAVLLGYTAIGIVLYPKSKRFVQKDRAMELSEYAKQKILTVAVGIHFDEVKDVASNFDYFQVSDFVNSPKLILSVEDRPKVEASLFIFDKSRGSGISLEIPEWFSLFRDRMILAGGLNPQNVYDIVNRFKPFGVDVSSGVEASPGVKDKKLMAEFIKECKRGLR